VLQDVARRQHSIFTLAQAARDHRDSRGSFGVDSLGTLVNLVGAKRYHERRSHPGDGAGSHVDRRG
jgi:hypothetical protein